jgi:hypothetical protein
MRLRSARLWLNPASRKAGAKFTSETSVERTTKMVIRCISAVTSERAGKPMERRVAHAVESRPASAIACASPERTNSASSPALRMANGPPSGTALAKTFLGSSSTSLARLWACSHASRSRPSERADGKLWATPRDCHADLGGSRIGLVLGCAPQRIRTA